MQESTTFHVEQIEFAPTIVVERATSVVLADSLSVLDWSRGNGKSRPSIPSGPADRHSWIPTSITRRQRMRLAFIAACSRIHQSLMTVSQLPLQETHMPLIVCRPKSLPVHRLDSARRRAIAINPANAVEHRVVARTPTGRRGGPRRLAVVIGRRWPASGVRLSVQFVDNPPKDLRARILGHMNAWNKTANVVFTETRGTGEVRIARLDSPEDMAGYWSYVGTEILEIEHDQPTLNLEGFTMRVSDAEFRRVVRHEAGHTLGFDHEHMRTELVQRIDRKKAIAFFDKDQGWTPEEVREQVLTPLEKKSIMGTTDADSTSIMCYQIPGAITKNGKPILGGKDINPKDFAFAASIYPKRVATNRRAR